MKQNLLFSQASAIGKRIAMVLTMLLIVGIGQAWGAETTVTWTASSGALGDGVGTGNIKTGSYSWNYTRTLISGTSYTGWQSSCVQIGKNGGVENITFSTSNIPGTIKKVSVECSSYQGKHNIAISVGGTSYLPSTSTSSWTTVSAKTGSGTSYGTIQILLTGGTRALYIKSISVTYEEAAATVPVTGVSLDKSTLTLTEGDSETLTAIVAPANATDKTVTWSTSDANIATVSNGKVTAIAEGSATITVKTKDGNKTATCNVTVNPKPKYTVNWYVNGNKEYTQMDVAGATLTNIPNLEDYECGSKVFVGWTTQSSYENATNAPNDLITNTAGMTIPENGEDYYAVFAETGGLSDENEVLLNFTGGTKNDLTNTEGITASGLGSDYAESNAPYRVKFDNTGDYIQYKNESCPFISQVYFKVKMIGGANTSKITIKTSDDGTNYTERSICEISGNEGAVLNFTENINVSAKYLQLYFTKGSNVGLGPLIIYTKSSSYQNYTTKCVQTYKVTFNANGHGTAPTAQNVEENKKATEPTAPTATGYTFGGWYTDQACSDNKKYNFNNLVTSDITLYAKWTAETYTITLDANGGKFVEDGTESTTIEIKYTHGTYASYDAAQLISEYLEEKGITLSREGYQLNEMWQSNGSSWKRVFTAINRTITAQWSKLYTITLSENGKETTPTTQTATSYTLPTELPAGTCQDDTKEFVGWTTNQDLSLETTPTSDFYKKGETVTLSEDKTTFYAVFATVDGGGTTDNTNAYTSNVSINAGTAITNTSVVIDQEEYNATKAGTGSANGSVIVTIPAGTTYLSFYMAGWKGEGDKIITLTGAEAEPSSFKTIADNGVTGNGNYELVGNVAQYAYSTTLNNVTQETQITFSNGGADQRFVIWGVNASAGATYSNYSTKCVPTCKITYNFDGGDGECTTDIVEKGSEYTLCSTAPTRAGHEFLNWKDQHGTKKYAAGATINSVTEDLTLTAQWQVNSYEVTWMSLGSKLSSSKMNYNAQPTKPATNPTYLCGTDKEFVGWTTQEIEVVGTPVNLYTNDFPAVTADVTYHAVFATKSEDGGSLAKATSLTSGETVYLATESGIGVMGANTETNKDAAVSTTQSDWMAFTVVANGEQYQFKNGENYISAAAKSFKITATPSDFTFENSYIVYNVPTRSDAGNYVLLYNSNSGSFYRFYKISNMGKENYETFYIYKSNPTHTDYVTSCEEVGSDMSNSTKVITPSVESGIFSVGDGKYVQFSTGNLQYEVGTNTWSFASEQYEVIGGEAYTGSNNTNYGMNVPGYTGKLDLFAWSSDGKFGVNPSNTDDAYGYDASNFVDWSELVDGEEGWCTLTQNEMNYILNRKKDGKKLWALATVNDLVGLILLPDNWDTNINLVYGYIPEKFVYTKNLLSIAEWQTLEEAGAVFLPAGGSRTGGYGNTDKAGGMGTIDANGHYFHVDNVNIYGYYWLNTQDLRDTHKNCASFLILPGWDEGPTVDEEGLDDLSTRPQVWSREKRRGNSVRLVKAIEPNYTRDKQSAGVYGTVCYPENIVWCEGATLYKVAGKEGNKVIFDEVTTPEAGMPYIFIAEQEKLNFFCGDEKEIEAGKHNSLQGTFTQIDPAVDNILVDNYMLVNNIIKKCGINCGLYANRAYFVAADLENMDEAPAAAPGRRRISLDVTSENTTTGLDNITNGENTTVKVIENGQLIIIRNGEKFNAQGQKL